MKLIPFPEHYLISLFLCIKTWEGTEFFGGWTALWEVGEGLGGEPWGQAASKGLSALRFVDGSCESSAFTASGRWLLCPANVRVPVISRDNLHPCHSGSLESELSFRDRTSSFALSVMGHTFPLQAYELLRYMLRILSWLYMIAL